LANDAHLAAVADSRYLMRRAFRMVDEEARKAGLDPLASQALGQIVGTPRRTRSITELATRLDVPLGLVSRLARQLEDRGLVVRAQSPDDGRVTLVSATPEGEEVAQGINDVLQSRFQALREVLSYEERVAALDVWAGNFGVRDRQ
jgi:DNA-binding MarR family transcriptional regulator